MNMNRLSFFRAWSFIFSVLALIPLCKAQDSKTKIYTLHECIQQAMDANPEILAAKQDVVRSKGGVIQARAVLYPTLRSDAQLFWENEDLLNQTPNATPAQRRFDDDWLISLNLLQTIYSGGVHQNRVAIAEFENEIEAIRLQETINLVVYETTVAFYDVLLNESEIKTRKQTIDLLNK